MNYHATAHVGCFALIVGLLCGNPLMAVLGVSAVVVAVYNLAVEKDSQPPTPPAVS